MSIFKKFLESSENIKIEHIMTSKDKSAHYFINMLGKSIKSLGLLAVLIPMGVQASNDLNNFNKSEVNKIINSYAQNNNLPLENTQVIYKETNNGTHSLHEMGNMKTCKIIISTKGGGEFPKILSNNYNFNKKLYSEMVVNHEMSHCIDNKKFIGTGLSYNSEKWMNDWVVGEYAQSNTLKNIFEENFADSLGALTLLRNNNFSNSSIEFLKQWAEVRFNINKDSEQNGSYFEDHNTASSILYILDNINEIKYVSNEDYIKIANNLASQSVMQSINYNRKVQKDFLIDENGNIKSGGVKNLGDEGVKILNDIIANPISTIRGISVSIIYEYKKEGQLQSKNSSSYEIAKNGFYFFNDNDPKNETTENLIDRLDYQLTNGNYYKKMIEKNKVDNNYAGFKKEIVKFSVSKIKNLKIEYVFNEDNKMKNELSNYKKTFKNKNI